MTGGRGAGSERCVMCSHSALHALYGKGTWGRQNGRKEMLCLEGKTSYDLGPCIS